MWAHDHRFFFTAENVYKGNLGMVNYYSGRDRGNEVLNDGVNLRLPSGSLLRFRQPRFRRQPHRLGRRHRSDGQYFFDIFDTDGFLGDVMLVNFAYAPFMQVLPRKYRFRILSAGMSRFIQLQLADSQRQCGAVPADRQRRQSVRQPDHADLARPAGHRRALRHHRRLLDLQDRRQGHAGEHAAADRRAQARRAAFAEAGTGRQSKRPGGRRDPAIPDRQSGSKRRRSGRHPPRNRSRSEPGAGRPDRADPDRHPGATRVVQWGRSGGGDSRGPNGQCIPDCPDTAVPVDRHRGWQARPTP